MSHSEVPVIVNRTVQSGSGVLIDIRAPSDWANGIPAGALCLSEEQLQATAEQWPSDDQPVYVICYRGQTSQRLVQQLNDHNVGQFVSVNGGFEAWLAMNLPVAQVEVEASMLRYERQIKLPGFGLQAQQRLSQAHVLVVGAGGLGSPALLYLAGSGIGQLTLVDADTVALHNLHRQILFTEAEVGQSKVQSAAERLKQLNSSIKINTHKTFLTAENAEQLMTGVDLILDGSDNINTRLVINDFSLRFNIPWVFAAVSGFDVQLSIFTGNPEEPCYRCLFPDLEHSTIANCSQEGILGPIPAVAAMIQTTEAIKYLSGMGQTLRHQMLSYDLFNHQFKVLKYPANKSKHCQHEQVKND